MHAVWPVDHWCCYQPVASSSKISFVFVRRAYLEHKFWQFWIELLCKLIILLNKPYFLSAYQSYFRNENKKRKLELLHFVLWIRKRELLQTKKWKRKSIQQYCANLTWHSNVNLNWLLGYKGLVCSSQMDQYLTGCPAHVCWYGSG